jgi:hypothetical protein
MYLVTSPVSQLKGVVKRQLQLAGRGRSSLIRTANSVLLKYELQVALGEAGVHSLDTGDEVAPKLVSKCLKVAQKDRLVSRLKGKIIRGVFFLAVPGRWVGHSAVPRMATGG